MFDDTKFKELFVMLEEAIGGGSQTEYLLAWQSVVDHIPLTVNVADVIDRLYEQIFSSIGLLE